MSAILESVLDPERRAACLANDAALGIPPAPPVELDEAFFARSDLAMLALKQADGYGQRQARAALNRQIDANRRDPLMPRGAY